MQLLLSETQREMETGCQIGALYGGHLGMSLSIALIQKYRRNESITPTAKGASPEFGLQRALEYIAANTIINLDDLAGVANMSRFHFARLFRQGMGVTPHRYPTIRHVIQPARQLYILYGCHLHSCRSGLDYF